MATAATLAISALSAYGTYQQGEEAKDIAAINAKAAEADAKARADRVKDDAEKLRSKQLAAYASSGVAIDGTPAAVLAETELNAELDAMEILYSGQAQADIIQKQGDSINKNQVSNTLLSGAQSYR